MILLIDNYDSFTYNLYQYVAEISTQTIEVFRNDKINIQVIQKKNPTHIILSPGPKFPVDAGICIPLIQEFYHRIPIFGICLGHQAIAESFGANVLKTPHVMHGKTSDIVHLGNSVLYENIPKTFKATRYHSLIVEKKSLPKELEITSETHDGVIMGIKHTTEALFGCQYHPESILTDYGKQHFKNFLQI